MVNRKQGNPTSFQNDLCPSSCLLTDMYFGPVTRGRQNEERSDIGWAIFYFRRDVKSSAEYYVYSLLSMVAEIGGYVGLLTGVSLFRVARQVRINSNYIGYIS